MPRRTPREIAESLRTPIPPPARKTRRVASWRGLKPGDRLVHQPPHEDTRVWVVGEVTPNGAIISTGDGSFGMLTDPQWRPHWTRARKTRKPKSREEQ